MKCSLASIVYAKDYEPPYRNPKEFEYKTKKIWGKKIVSANNSSLKLPSIHKQHINIAQYCNINFLENFKPNSTKHIDQILSSPSAFPKRLSIVPQSLFRKNSVYNCDSNFLKNYNNKIYNTQFPNRPMKVHLLRNINLLRNALTVSPIK